MTTKVKLKARSDGHDVLVLAKHPMETGNRKDKTSGKVIPAHYITTMTFSVNGDSAAEVSLSQGVSVNPLIGTSIPNLKAGDVVTISWVDNQGGGESAEATVK